ncbi:MAG: tRNA (adenosine(37)-N6)-dimethylallyltransferase MiaA [Thermodesulfobacteriota bacterium]
MQRSNSDSCYNLIVLAGPTGIGKTKISLGLAEKLGGEIVSMDSVQVYRYMDIGTAKPGAREKKEVAHHLIDIVDPDDTYNTGRFIRDASKAIEDITGRGRLPLLVGGTGLYMKGLLEGITPIPRIPEEIREKIKKQLKDLGNEELYRRLQEIDPVTADRISINDSQRLTRALEIFETSGRPWSDFLAENENDMDQEEKKYNPFKICLNCAREILYDRINRRTYRMIEKGLIQEVEGLLAMGYGPDLPALQSIGYQHMINYLEGIWDKDEAIDLMARDTRRYAKRQLTWFSRDPDIHWFRPKDKRSLLEAARSWLKKQVV